MEEMLNQIIEKFIRDYFYWDEDIKDPNVMKKDIERYKKSYLEYTFKDFLKERFKDL